MQRARSCVSAVVGDARRGVNVRIVVSQESNNAQATAALKSHYSALLHAGVEIWEYPAAVVHAKLVVADDTRRIEGLIWNELACFL